MRAAPDQVVSLAAPAPSARAPWNMSPVTNKDDNEQENRHEEQPRGLGGIGSVTMMRPVLVIGGGLRWNRIAHVVIVASRIVVGSWSTVVGRQSLVDCFGRVSFVAGRSGQVTVELDSGTSIANDWRLTTGDQRPYSVNYTRALHADVPLEPRS